MIRSAQIFDLDLDVLCALLLELELQCAFLSVGQGEDVDLVWISDQDAVVQNGYKDIVYVQQRLHVLRSAFLPIFDPRFLHDGGQL